jgi:hypothetical protein
MFGEKLRPQRIFCLFIRSDFSLIYSLFYPFRTIPPSREIFWSSYQPLFSIPRIPKLKTPDFFPGFGCHLGDLMPEFGGPYTTLYSNSSPGFSLFIVRIHKSDTYQRHRLKYFLAFGSVSLGSLNFLAMLVQEYFSGPSVTVES